MSELIVLLILGYCVFCVYRIVKKRKTGSLCHGGSCCNCSKSKSCGPTAHNLAPTPTSDSADKAN